MSLEHAPKNENLVDDLLDGVAAFAAFTGFTRRRIYYLLERGMLPGSKLGRKWIGTKTAVRQRLTAGSSK